MTEAPAELLAHPDYEFVRPLGRGGMGTIFLVRNRLLDRREVVKVVSGAVLARVGTRDRFLQEIRSAARLQHPNVVAAFAGVRLRTALGFVMEYVAGDDLDALVRAKGPLPVPVACGYLLQALHGLQHAHERGMVHRDVKPANLMRTRADGRTVVKVLDFGLAKATSEEPAENGLTLLGQVIGTPAYMAPEQVLSASTADTRADLYAVGCCLYFLVCGHPPFPGPTIYELFDAHRNRRPTPLDEVRPGVPAGLAAWAAKLLAKEPRRRFQTPVEAADALAPFARRPDPQPPSHSYIALDAPVPGRSPDTLTAAATPALAYRPAVAKPPAPKSKRVPVAPVAPPARTAYLDPGAFSGPAVDPIVRRRRQRRDEVPVWLPVALVLAVAGLVFVLVGVAILSGKPADPPAVKKARPAAR